MLNLLLITLSYLFPTKPASCWYIYKVIMLIFHVPKQTCTFYNNQYICNKQCQNIESFVITNGQKKKKNLHFCSSLGHFLIITPFITLVSIYNLSYTIKHNFVIYIIIIQYITAKEFWNQKAKHITKPVQARLRCIINHKFL